MTLGERIKKVRKEKDLTQREFGRLIGIKPNSISLIEMYSPTMKRGEETHQRRR